MAEIVRNSSEQTDSDEFLTNQFVGIILSEKSIRRNFVRPSDDFLTNTEKRHSDELPTIFRCGHTRPEFIGKTIYRRRTFLGLFRRTQSSENTDGLWFVGRYRRTMVRRNFSRNPLRRYLPTNHSPSVYSDAHNSSEYINFKNELILHFYIFFYIKN